MLPGITGCLVTSKAACNIGQNLSKQISVMNKPFTNYGSL